MSEDFYKTYINIVKGPHLLQYKLKAEREKRAIENALIAVQSLTLLTIPDENYRQIQQDLTKIKHSLDIVSDDIEAVLYDALTSE